MRDLLRIALGLDLLDRYIRHTVREEQKQTENKERTLEEMIAKEEQEKILFWETMQKVKEEQERVDKEKQKAREEQDRPDRKKKLLEELDANEAEAKERLRSGAITPEEYVRVKRKIEEYRRMVAGD